MSTARWETHRNLSGRIVVEGRLVLTTAAHLGGAGEGWSDMPLALDPREGLPLLTGTSLAGALRAYLRRREQPWGQRSQAGPLETALFGAVRAEGENEQSALLTSDALGRGVGQHIERRDGVAILPQTRTAEERKRYDLELLPAGTEFPLRCELLLREGEEEMLRRALAVALQGYERGEIPVGARTRRGFGRGRVGRWRVRIYRDERPDDLLAWLQGSDPQHTRSGDRIAPLLAIESELPDRRDRLLLEARMVLDGSLLIRSEHDRPDAPDTVQLRTMREGKQVPIISGTALAGALRARALRIVQTLCGDPAQAYERIDALFGVRDLGAGGAAPRASRIAVHEAEVHQALDLVHTRLKIDRFTGGAFPGALYDAQPVFGRCDGSTQALLRLEVDAPQPWEAGLLLLLLKDLWTGDLPLGGEAGVGRGRLRGLEARLCWQGKEWTIHEDNGRLQVDGAQDDLESYVSAFCEEVSSHG